MRPLPLRYLRSLLRVRLHGPLGEPSSYPTGTGLSSLPCVLGSCLSVCYTTPASRPSRLDRVSSESDLPSLRTFVGPLVRSSFYRITPVPRITSACLGLGGTLPPFCRLHTPPPHQSSTPYVLHPSRTSSLRRVLCPGFPPGFRPPTPSTAVRVPGGLRETGVRGLVALPFSYSARHAPKPVGV